MGWTDLAECRGTNTRIWFPFDDRGRNLSRPTDDSAYATAKVICDRCPVRAQCLEHALSVGERHGMWGGLTPQQRHTIRTNRKKAS